MSRGLRVLLAAIAAMMLPLVMAHAQETVKVGQDVKRAFGTVTAMNAGDTACYLELKDDRGGAFEEMARFEICEQPALLGKRVALTYVLQNVMSPTAKAIRIARRLVSSLWSAPPGLPRDLDSVGSA